jgi:hypothetical protein
LGQVRKIEMGERGGVDGRNGRELGREKGREKEGGREGE